MSTIRKLDENLIRQVAAGEVVQRPASILKECLENALDAGATAIDIRIEQGGVGRIQIQDNGHGIKAAELPLALQRHATSKIQSLADLEAVESFGFRGEALASIAAVSRFTIESKHHSASVGAKIVLFDTQTEGETIPSDCASGTLVTIDDVFYNVPARRRFLRADRTEYRYLDDVIKKMALSHFDTRFVVTNNGKRVRDLPAVCQADRAERIAAILGHETERQLIDIEAGDMGMQLHGWLSKPCLSRSQADMQYFFVNSRVIKDKAVAHAIRRAYSDMMQSGRHPSYVLYLSIDPHVVDVNVHPSKEEIRFADTKMVTQFIYQAVLHVLRQAPEPSYSNTFLPTTAPSPVFNRQADDTTVMSPPTQTLTQKQQQYIAQETAQEAEIKESMVATMRATAQKPLASIEHPPLGYAIGQLGGAFILAENQQGLLIVDMHAAHERVLYEQMKTAYAAEGVTSQHLLVPLTISLQDTERAVIEAVSDIYTQLGFQYQLPPQGVVIQAVPAVLHKADIGQLFIDVTAELVKHDTHDHVQHVIHEILSTMACHSAVRANDYIHKEQMNGLLRKMERTASYEQCNHGRPTCKQFTSADLDAFFRRGT